MGRAGSTFLQYQVFPKIRGLTYIQRTRFRRAKKIIARGRSNKYLVSGELDNRLIERYLKAFTDPHRDARPILVIRRHDEWIASQYRRYLKNGHHWTFSDFFDIAQDQGYWKQESLLYYPIIELLETYFDHKPLVLLYDDLRKAPEGFIRKIVDYMDADLDMDRVNFSPRHASYNKKQLMAIYNASSKTNLLKRRPFKKKWQNVPLNLWTNLKRYAILYGYPILPVKSSGAEHIFPSDKQMKMIRETYAEDWQRCLAKADKNP